MYQKCSIVNPENCPWNLEELDTNEFKTVDDIDKKYESDIPMINMTADVVS